MTEKSIVLVAIPSKEDYVWKISSEKVPHLTLLYLSNELGNLLHVESYIQHVAKTMIHKFYLSVERRGELGTEFADVLFFDEHYATKMLEELRTYLLDDRDIRAAYETAQQFPSWTPHLTLGYPATPAKPDTREYPGIGSVCFDRIALWYGDYEGTEFPLKTDDYDDYARMSELGKNFLQHYGVRGMKWGVIRDRVRGSAGKLRGPAAKLVLPSDDHVRSAVVQGKAKLGGVHTLSNKELRDVINRMDLEVKFKELKTIKHNQSLIGKGATWASRVATDILVGTAVSWLRRPGFRASKYTARPTNPNIRVIDGELGGPRAISK